MKADPNSLTAIVAQTVIDCAFPLLAVLAVAAIIITIRRLGR